MQHSKTVEPIDKPVTPTTPQPETKGTQPLAKKPIFGRNILERFSEPTDNQMLEELEEIAKSCQEPVQYSAFFGEGSNEQFLSGIQKALKEWEKAAVDSGAAESEMEEDLKKDSEGNNGGKKRKNPAEILDVNGNKIARIDE